MDKECYIQQFSIKFHEFLSNLNIIFKNDEELIRFGKNVNNVNMTKLASRYIKILGTHKDKIESKDETIFNEDIYIFPAVNMSRLWNSNISDKTKNVFWQYIQFLYLLGDIIVSGKVSDSLVNVINDDIQIIDKDKDKTDDPANLLSMLDASNITNILNKLTDFGEEDIAMASDNIKKIFKENDSKTSNLMCDIVTDISEELSNKKNSDTNGISNIIKIAENIAEKFKPQIESGNFDINELLGSAQSAMGQMYKSNNGQKSSETDQLNNMMAQLMGQLGNLNLPK